MRLSANELAILEQALQVAINNGYDYRSVLAYREMLSKLQSVPIGSVELEFGEEQNGIVGHAAEAGGGPMAGSVWSVGESPEVTATLRDGLRYDMDDGDGEP